MSSRRPSSDQSGELRRTARRLLRDLRADRARTAAVLVLSVLAVGMTLAVPALLGRATDIIVDGVGSGTVDVAGVVRILTTAALSTAVAWLCQVGQGRLIAGGGAAVGVPLARAHRAQAVPASAALLRQPGARGGAVPETTNDIDNLAQSVQQVAARVLASFLLLIGSVTTMLLISPLLAVAVLMLTPPTIWTATAIGKRAQPQFATQWAATGRLNSHVEEVYTGHEVVTAFGRQAEAARTFAEHNEDLRSSGIAAQFVSGLLGPAMTFLGNINYVLVAVLGGMRVASGALSIGDIQAFIQYVMQFNQPLATVASLAGQIQSAAASAERVFELLDAEEQRPDAERPLRLESIDGQVSFADVSFRYRTDEPLIENLSLHVRPGQTVAIVGPTGAGKSTLVNLLLRFYELDGGTITIDGTDIAGMSREELRRNIGMVLQDTWLFSGTITDNIAYGMPDASRGQVVDAAGAVHADHLIRTLPGGYDTVLDPEGGGLSAGERQLITIARAFLSSPAILVLDEATSSVDSRTEMLVQRAMTSLRRGRTSFVIAHRLSTIRDADLILVMEAGRIVEQGSHHELLAADGAYAGLYAAQFAQTTAA